MTQTVIANDGVQLPVEALAQEFTYDGDFVATITVVYNGIQYVQTFVNDSTNIIYFSGWINSAAPQINQLMTDESGDLMVAEDGELMVTQ